MDNPILTAPSVAETERLMLEKLSRITPPAEVRIKAEIAFEVNQLKRRRNAVILGHNYMEAALYVSVPDYTGDSLALSAIAAKTPADIIVFCGVQFMAETAKVLNPGKTVLIPAEKAGCSLAEGVTVEDVRSLRSWFPGAPVVTYVNTYADVKAESDYCCTSGNADKVLKHILEKGCQRVIFLPDEYLARNTAAQLGVRFVPGWEAQDAEAAGRLAAGDGPAVIGWKAHCEVHELFTVDDVLAVRKQFPEAITIAHPECTPEVMAMVDVAGSTKLMVDYIRSSSAKQFVLFTECAMGDNIAADCPDKEMVRLCSHRCKHMALITLEDTLAALEKTQFQIELPADIIECARLPINRMLEIA